MFTISIVTNRGDNLIKNIHRLRLLPQFEEIKVNIFLNNLKPGDQYCISEALIGLSNVKQYYCETFIQARNRAISECTTKWMLFLDDDDYLTVNVVAMINYYIEKYGDTADMINFRYEKVGRFDGTPTGENKSNYTENFKILMLSDFDKYELSRQYRIYLGNGNSLLNVESIKKWDIKWKYPYCDDIYPITNLYIRGTIVKSHELIGVYPIQTTVTEDKSEEQIKLLEDDMVSSYSDLIELFGKENPILYLAVHNSYRQLQVINHYTSERLRNLVNLTFVKNEVLRNRLSNS